MEFSKFSCQKILVGCSYLHHTLFSSKIISVQLTKKNTVLSKLKFWKYSGKNNDRERSYTYMIVSDSSISLLMTKSKSWLFDHKDAANTEQ